jgi:hypothetical protein
MVDNIVYSSDQNRSYKIRANENFEFLCAIRSNLNSEERERLLALSSPTSLWKFLAFDWLENKRAKYDPSYAELRIKEQALAKANSRLRELEQEQALRSMDKLDVSDTHAVVGRAFEYLKAKGKI